MKIQDSVGNIPNHKEWYPQSKWKQFNKRPNWQPSKAIKKFMHHEYVIFMQTSTYLASSAIETINS